MINYLPILFISKDLSSNGFIIVVFVLCGLFLLYFLYTRAKEAYGRLTEKKKGYIISVRYREFFNDCYGSIRIYVDGKVYDVRVAKKDILFFRLYNSLSNRYSCYDDVLVKGIPIDVYIVGNDIYPDYDSLGDFL